MLPMVPFDTHAAVKTLTSAGASEEIAVAVVDVAQGAAAKQGRDLATRADIAELRAELAAQRVEFTAQREPTHTAIETLRARIDTSREATRADIAELRAEQAHMETRLIKWVVGTALVVGALIVAVLRPDAS